jgi:Arc/MetJ-type ribon-helix-helix transcriptional regulator
MSLSVRIPEHDKSLLEKVCKARGEDVSDFVRRSIRKELASLSFLSADERKALGMKTEDGTRPNQEA